MAQVNKIDSNFTGLRYQEETSFKVANPANDWIPLEPNSYADFGGQITTIARNPINASRQRKKGVTSDLDASGGINTDLTKSNLRDLLQGFFFADLREKSTNKPNNATSFVITNVDGTAEQYQTAAGDWTIAPALMRVGDLIFAEGFGQAANNGLKRVTVVAALNLTVFENLITEVPPTTAKVSAVGFQFAAGDADIDAAGSKPALTTTVKDLTELGLSVGEWVFLGGDAASTFFANAGNNGFARVFSIAANRIEFDKTQGTMVTEASTTETIQLFKGASLRNEIGTLIKRRTYQLERTLGAPDDALPTQIQAEYIVGAVPGELTLNVPTAEKVNIDLSFVGADVEFVVPPTALKAGPRPALVEADAFNTSSDVTRFKLAVYSPTSSNPLPLFAFVQEITLTLNNNISPNKAVGVLGAFEVTAGQFTVGGNLTAYFSNITAVQAVRDNADITIDLHIVKDNGGLSFDVPLVTLGDGRPNVEQDQPITLPLSSEAATGAKLAAALDYTLLVMFWDYLPDRAE